MMRNNLEYRLDLECFSLLFDLLNKVRLELTRKYYNPSKTVLEERVQWLEEVSAVSLLVVDYLRSRFVKNFLTSLSMRELFVTISFREAKLATFNLTSAHLSDEIHESLHRIVKKQNTNYCWEKSSSAILQSVSNLWHNALVKYFCEFEAKSAVEQETTERFTPLATEDDSFYSVELIEAIQKDMVVSREHQVFQLLATRCNRN